MMTIYALQHPENIRPLKALITASHAGVQIQVCHKFRFGQTDSTSEWARNCHPLGRSPVLQTEEGYLFESNAIVRYVARLDRHQGNLYGRTPYEAGQVDMWIDFASSELEPLTMDYLMQAIMGVQIASETAKEVADSLDVLLASLDTWLETRTFLVGERMTIADIVLACTLQWLYRFNPDAEALSKKFKGSFRLYNSVMQHHKTVEALKAFGSTFGVPPKAKDEKPKKEEVKPKKNTKNDEDDEEEPSHEEKKKPNPLDALSPSNFVFDAFKREYSNNDKRTVGAPFLFKNFDSVGFSAFWCKYKYNEENKMQFMTGNLVRGWFQRMEAVRKYAFGIVLIIGEEKSHEIEGLWIFRGKGIPECVKDVEDTELFVWTEVTSLNTEADRITDFLCCEGVTILRPVLEGRCFK